MCIMVMSHKGMKISWNLGIAQINVIHNFHEIQLDQTPNTKNVFLWKPESSFTADTD